MKFHIRPIVLLLLFIFPISLFLSGCWSAHELTDELITIGFAIDKVGDKVRLTVQVLHPEQIISSSPSEQKGSGSSDEEPFTLLSYDGNSIQEAFQGIGRIAPKLIYGGHNQVIFIGEALAREGIMQYLDHFARHRWSHDSTWIIIAKGGTGQQLLTVTNSDSKYPSMGLGELMESGKIHIPNLFEFLLKYHADRGSQVLAYARSSQNITSPPGFQQNQLVVQQGALIRGDKLIGYLSDTNSETYNWLQDGFHNVRLSLESKSVAAPGQIGLMLNGAAAKIKTVDSGGLALQVDVQTNFVITDNSPTLQDPKDITALENEVNQTISQKIESLFVKLQQEQMDVFDVAENVHAYHSELWQEIEAQWPEVYANLPIQINVNSHYRNSGIMAKSPGIKD